MEEKKQKQFQILEGPSELLPANTAIPGAFYITTDEGGIYLGLDDNTLFKIYQMKKGSGESAVVINDFNNTASGPNALAVNTNTEAAGEGAFAQGVDTHAMAEGAHSEGFGTHAEGKYSHVEGSGSKALEEAAHAEGIGSEAQGKASHVGGTSSYAIGENSFAHGNGAKANSANSIAFGSNVTANGDSSVAFGQGTQTAEVLAQFVIGKYNEAKNNALFQIGAGEDAENRQNAFEIIKVDVEDEISSIVSMILGGATLSETEINRIKDRTEELIGIEEQVSDLEDRLNGMTSSVDFLDFELSEDKTYYILKGIGFYYNPIVTIPSKYNGLPVKKIADSAFANMANKFASFEFEADENGLIYLEEIGNNAFKDAKFDRVKIPSTVKKIGDNAFNCANVIHLDGGLPDSLEYVGTGCFSTNMALALINDGNGVAYGGNGELTTPIASISTNLTGSLKKEYYLGNRNNRHLIAYAIREAFTNSSSKPAISFKERCKILYHNAFLTSSSTAVTYASITLPSTLTQIGTEAFRVSASTYVSYNASVNMLIIPASIKYVSVNAFQYLKIDSTSKICFEDISRWAEVIFVSPSSYSSPCWNLPVPVYHNDEDKTRIREIFINVEKIPAYSFYNMIIPTVITGEKARAIGNYAFYQGSATPETMWNLYLYEGIKTIGANAFYDYRNSSSNAYSNIYFPSTLTSLGDSSLYRYQTNYKDQFKRYFCKLKASSLSFGSNGARGQTIIRHDDTIFSGTSSISYGSLSTHAKNATPFRVMHGGYGQQHMHCLRRFENPKKELYSKDSQSYILENFANCIELPGKIQNYTPTELASKGFLMIDGDVQGKESKFKDLKLYLDCDIEYLYCALEISLIDELSADDKNRLADATRVFFDFYRDTVNSAQADKEYSGVRIVGANSPSAQFLSVHSNTNIVYEDIENIGLYIIDPTDPQYFYKRIEDDYKIIIAAKISHGLGTDIITTKYGYPLYFSCVIPTDDSGDTSTLWFAFTANDTGYFAPYGRQQHVIFVGHGNFAENGGAKA